MKTPLPRLAAIAILTLGTVFAGVGDGRAQAVPPAHIAIVDYLLIQQQSLAMNDLKAQIEQRRQVYQEQINLQEQELRATDQELVRQKSILAADAFAQKRREFEARVAEVQRAVQARKRELDRAFDFGLKEFERQVISIIAELAGTGDRIKLPDHFSTSGIKRAHKTFGVIIIFNGHAFLHGRTNDNHVPGDGWCRVKTDFTAHQINLYFIALNNTDFKIKNAVAVNTETLNGNTGVGVK